MSVSDKRTSLLKILLPYKFRFIEQARVSYIVSGVETIFAKNFLDNFIKLFFASLTSLSDKLACLAAKVVKARSEAWE